MKYAIVATLGPSSDTEAVWATMLAAGVTAFRLNTSHLSLPQLQDWLARIEAFIAPLELKPPLILDLQGSKWRLGQFVSREFTPEQKVKLVCAAATTAQDVLPVPHADFFRAALVSDGEIVLNDAKVCLEIEAAGADSIDARVTKGGELSDRKGITLAASPYRQESLNEKDQAIVVQTQQFEYIQYAISYVKDAVEMARYRSLLGRSAYLIAKLERSSAMRDAQQIAAYADEFWVCRGDLGAELGLFSMAETVSRFANVLSRLSSPVLMAGQVLEHTCGCATPTRSEICYLYETLMKGYQGVVLSDETAIGRYPVESCRAAALFQRPD